MHWAQYMQQSQWIDRYGSYNCKTYLKQVWIGYQRNSMQASNKDGHGIEIREQRNNKYAIGIKTQLEIKGIN